tara:strand:- start:27803 stop:28084 length:282 start_codon:yes stop_codon:yes gene_type:complete
MTITQFKTASAAFELARAEWRKAQVQQGATLRLLRKSSGVRIDTLAASMGCSAGQLSRLENGTADWTAWQVENFKNSLVACLPTKKGRINYAQ